MYKGYRISWVHWGRETMLATAPITPLPRCSRPLLLRSTPMIGFRLPVVPLRSFRKTVSRIEASDRNEHPSISGI
ncbi:hypothetical protein DsansV1_C04g0041571 [Dioscorea sansibarensis]